MSPGLRPVTMGMRPNSRHSPVTPRLLASVATLAEVELALTGGAELIDLKDPAAGALGAWPLTQLAEAVALVAGRRPLSATVGDLPPDAGSILASARATAATGVDIVKLGFFPGADHRALAWDLAPLAEDGIRIVAVLMADREPDLGIADTLAAAGFLGVMLDTADKQSGSLLRHLDVPALGAFVRAARGKGLVAGLAGSLRREDVATLAPLGPDILGFRGALCHSGRTSILDVGRLGELRYELDAMLSPNPTGSTCHRGHAANIVT